MDIKIIPGKLNGEVIIPPSKSLSHRAIIAGAMAKGKSSVTNLIMSDDIEATIEAMEALGVSISKGEHEVEIEGTGTLVRKESTINCRESGSTVRFLVPISLLADGEVTFIGEGRLAKRPLTTFFNIFNDFGVKYERGEDYLPLTIKGKLTGGRYKMKGNVSSQFITGLMYTLPKLKEDSVIEITTPLESIGYVDLTLDMLKKSGIEIENKDYKEFHIKGNQEFKPVNYRVEGDYSQGAFWMVAATLGAGLDCIGLEKESLQGDKEILDIITKMGGTVKNTDKGLTSEFIKTNGAVIDLSQCPDLGPIVTVMASVSEGETRIVNAQRLRIKESDRITAMVTELNKVGADITETEDGMIIRGVKKLKGGATVSSWNDHRIAMAMAVASTQCEEPIIIEGAESVKKSYPHFWEHFKQLGGKVEVL
ncbi:3-phosphoshikimate 1-carboxyvinyltransferase [uncultured Ilyobacter sp.]|uniref:3-phosphoshikimate 1-carboxyvinyltransferase n=1 Tax=uncultured Ilyobacter sp. TaxID=544433 RepID=UPI0029C077B4|nr:3-phosphoshikimate 1-carboxyvinyltransferase [uncultured Ilyobacter sp.]